jgi:hypothetical protein
MIEASEHLWKNKETLNTEDECFDFPDYGGLPKRCAKELSSGTVDWIQDTAPFKGMDKLTFQKSFVGLCMFEY